MVETGDILPKYNHYQFALLGYNVRIFYAPLGHLIVAWLSYFTTLPVHISYKIILLLSKRVEITLFYLIENIL